MTDIHTPDLAEALAADQSGELRTAITGYLSTWREKLEQSRRDGLAPEDYRAVERLSASLDQADKLLEFFATLKVLATSGTKPTE
jgi:hypothetical protein